MWNWLLESFWLHVCFECSLPFAPTTKWTDQAQNNVCKTVFMLLFRISILILVKLRRQHSCSCMKTHLRCDACCLTLQYIAASPGVQGAYMPHYPPMQAAPVSSLHLHLIQFLQCILIPAGLHLPTVHVKSSNYNWKLQEPVPVQTSSIHQAWSCFWSFSSRKTTNYVSVHEMRTVIIRLQMKDAVFALQENGTPQQVDSSNNSSPYSQLSK